MPGGANAIKVAREDSAPSSPGDDHRSREDCSVDNVERPLMAVGLPGVDDDGGGNCEESSDGEPETRPVPGAETFRKEYALGKCYFIH